MDESKTTFLSCHFFLFCVRSPQWVTIQWSALISRTFPIESDISEFYDSDRVINSWSSLCKRERGNCRLTIWERRACCTSWHELLKGKMIQFKRVTDYWHASWSDKKSWKSAQYTFHEIEIGCNWWINMSHRKYGVRESMCALDGLLMVIETFVKSSIIWTEGTERT